MVTWYAVPPVLSIAIFVTLLAGFTKIRRYIPFPAFLYAFLFLLWSAGELLERVSGPPPAERDVALIGVKIIAIAGAFLPSAFIHFSFVFPVRKKDAHYGILLALYITSAVIAMLSITTDLLISDMIVYAPGWGAVFGPGMLIWGTYIIGGTIIAIANLEVKSLRLSTAIGRFQTRWIAVALGISLCCATITGYIPPIFGVQDIYPLTTIPFAITGMLLYHVFVRYHMTGGNNLGPATGTEGVNKKVSSGYFWCDDKKFARKYFMEFLKQGVWSLYITVNEIPEKEVATNARVITISEKGDINPLDEERIKTLPFLIEKFVSQSENSIVLIESIEDLITHYFYSTTSFSEVLNEIRKCADSYNTMIICSFNREKLEEWVIEEITHGGKSLKSL